MILELHSKNPNPRDLKKVIDILNKDGVVIFPTDTIYAMGCRLDSKKAIERMCKITGKKVEKVNFSLICESLSHIAEYTAVLNKAVFRLMKNNLPGAFSFILKANNNVTKYFAAIKKPLEYVCPTMP
jgi:tRNA threonylcarbamoyl adenosine modification protein (Sua5/YciO/YrdC/YwlC family)